MPKLSALKKILQEDRRKMNRRINGLQAMKRVWEIFQKNSKECKKA